MDEIPEEDLDMYAYFDSLIWTRVLPRIRFKPKVLKQNYFSNELIEYFQTRPIKEEVRAPAIIQKDTAENLSSWGNEESPMSSTKLIPTLEEKNDSIDAKEAEKVELRVSKNGHPITSLHFNNPTDSFATRCDVIYKTLLRDCRKFFTDKFQVKMIKKSKNPQKLERELDEFVEINFSELSSRMIKEVKFYLGWLVYPKELVTNRAGLYDEKSNAIKGNERSKKVKKIKELHTFLYNFSMEKCEKFFENEALWKIFVHYIERIDERIKISSTMENNKDVYMAALGLIMKKISATLP